MDTREATQRAAPASKATAPTTGPSSVTFIHQGETYIFAVRNDTDKDQYVVGLMFRISHDSYPNKWFTINILNLVAKR